tara:strand:+ start:7334 stop:8401 length:1068 start_codon:yes stop_codon:yes gene_type:complete
MHWVTQDGTQLVYRRGEQRCILISSGHGPHEKMYAHLRPCDGKLASGIVTVAAAAAPPPPPGATTVHWYDPARAPPPPPSLKRRALELFTIHEIRPRTQALCAGGLEGRAHQAVCLETSALLAKWQPVYAAGVIAPFCHRMCWHSCRGEDYAKGVRTAHIEPRTHIRPSDPQKRRDKALNYYLWGACFLITSACARSQRDDGFNECPSESCASESCLQFLLNECPPKVHAQIQAAYDGACTLVPPSPPRPPSLPPPVAPLAPPPPTPGTPPPRVEYTERSKNAELDSDPDCELISYADCREVVRQFAARNANAGYLDSMEVSFAPCEGLTDEVDCFLVRTQFLTLEHQPSDAHAP